MTKHLVQIARTAALCGALGLGLYLALEAAAASPARDALANWLGLVLSVALSLVTIPATIAGWRSGELPGRPGLIERGNEPRWYWLLLTLEGACSLGLIALAAYCVWRLLG
ncbi:MAG: hypothetical protein ACK4MV_09885 [Beijerinckiaceae bacterium]